MGKPRPSVPLRDPAPVARTRDPWWDNARCVAAVLIVILHVGGSMMARHDVLHVFSVGTWPLRVPAFVLLAGVFSSAGPLGSRELRGLIGSLAVPAALFSLLYSTERWALGDGFTLHVAQLPWTLWFLMSLMCWRLLLPLVVQLRHPLPVTVGAALAVGYVEEFGLLFSASRTVVYLPLFYLGWRLGQGAWRSWFERRWTAWAAVAVLLLSLAAAAQWHRQVRGSWLSMRHSYSPGPFGLGLEWAWTVRLALLVWAVLMVASLLRLLPRGRVPYVSALGAAGFTVYLLHPLVILPLRELGVLRRVDSPWLLMAFGVLLAAVLGSPPVRRLARPLVRPPVDWLFAAGRTQPGGPADPGPPRGSWAGALREPADGRPPAGAAGAGSGGRSSWSGSSTGGGG
jgi:fucose 4-O-acetylase-like acetyltransferase